MKFWIFLIIILIIIALMIIFPGNPTHRLFLKYIKTILSIPVVILISVLTIILLFKESISERISKLREIEAGKIVKAKFQEEAKPIKDYTKKKLDEMYEKEKKKFSLMLNFERIIRYMFKSQYSLLKLLLMHKRTKTIMPKDLIESLFYKMEFLKNGGNPNYSFDSYLSWLEKFAAFIIQEKVDNKIMVKITKDGELFLDYINFMNYSDKEFIPF